MVEITSPWNNHNYSLQKSLLKCIRLYDMQLIYRMKLNAIYHCILYTILYVYVGVPLIRPR